LQDCGFHTTHYRKLTARNRFVAPQLRLRAVFRLQLEQINRQLKHKCANGAQAPDIDIFYLLNRGGNRIDFIAP
jgi:hypothetical protein